MLSIPRERSQAALARLGEKVCARWLMSHGYQILCKNYTCPIGEIDIIAKNDNTVVFVEVKTRTTCAIGTPEEAVTHSKQHRIRRVACYFLSVGSAVIEDSQALQCRFDVAAVTVDRQRRRAKIRWIVDAF